MSEFNDRMAAQREVLRAVNSGSWKSEPLFSLARNAINRWVTVNRLDESSHFVQLIIEASKKLFFLANKSQDQVSDEYRQLAAEFSKLLDEIRTEFRRVAVGK